ncbi:hypothetical protein R1sor_027426 [Riccia sorocarpa]|uniref:Sulfate transporter n=1 Tax=Riccia sorocarpa TaxID=122646 RepID=A0ABD3GE73_9MARC
MDLPSDSSSWDSDDDDLEECSEWELFLFRIRENLQFKHVNLWEEVSGSMGDLGTFIPPFADLGFLQRHRCGDYSAFHRPLQRSHRDYLWRTHAGFMNIATRLVPTPVIRGFQLSQGISFGITAIKYIVKKQDFMTGRVLGDRDFFGTDGVLLALIAFTFVVLVSGPGDDLVQQATDSEELDAKFSGYSNDNNDYKYSKLPASSKPSPKLYFPPMKVIGIGEEGSVRGGTMAEGLLRAALEESLLLSGYKEADLKNVDIDLEGGEIEKKTLRRKLVIPSALIVFFMGVVLALARDWGSVGKKNVKFIFGPSLPQLVKITWDDWKIGFLRPAVPQIPLSLISTVVAVTKLSNNLFPEKKNVTAMSVSTAVGIFNLVGCCLGTLPVECGAGGLAAQFRFGARSGLAVIFLGAVKLVLALFLGSSILRMLAEFPICLLGVILLLAGMEVAIFCRDQNTRSDAFVMAVCATVTLFGFSPPTGLACGFATYMLLKLRNKLRKYILTKFLVDLLQR